MKNKFSKLVQSFLTDYIIGECNYSNNTKQSYSTTFYLLIMFLNKSYNIKSEDIEINNITKEVIINFLSFLEEERKVSESTRNQRLACIKSFFKYVQVREPELFDTCNQILSIHSKKVPNKMITYLEENEIKMIIDYLNEQGELKKLTILCVLYETGCRVSELINIKLDDLNLSDNASITIYDKGRKTRIVPISQELTKLINKYLNLIYVDYGENYLFYSNQKKCYNRKTINYHISNIIRIVKEKYPTYFKKNYSPHCFRHSKATHLYNNGIPLLYIKDFLGHEHVSTTEVYATPDSKKQREQILKNSLELKSYRFVK